MMKRSDFYNVFNVKPQVVGQSEIKYLISDSRKIVIGEESVFFALVSQNGNGHEFIQEAYEKGVRVFVIQEPVSRDYHEAVFIKVEDTLTALQNLAKIVRDRFSKNVIGITGSNGKTIVKEWLSEALSYKYKVAKNPGSYNSQIGVPLSVWNLNENDDIGVFEAGISKVNEMSCLQEIIQPTIGIFTNIGTAHKEGFESEKQKVAEKLKLFSDVQCLVYCADYDEIDKQVLEKFDGVHRIAWSQNSNSKYSLFLKDHQLDVKFEGRNFSFDWKFNDAASIENIAHVIFCLLYLGWTQSEIQRSINQLEGVHGRLEIIKGYGELEIVNDSYNNDKSGLQKALEFHESQRSYKDKFLVLSEFQQHGDLSEEELLQLSKLVNGFKYKKVYLVGEGVKDLALAVNNVNYYSNTEDLLSNADFLKQKEVSILIKGAREFRFERILKTLEQKKHNTRLEINLDAIEHNLKVYRDMLLPTTKIMVMVKAFGYGSGGIEVARLLQFLKVDYLAVAYVDEGIELRQNGIYLPIMVLNPDLDSFTLCEEYKLEPEIFSFHHLDAYLKAKVSVPVHIKVDTGMHRLGFGLSDKEELVQALEANKVKVNSVFSHLAASDDTSESDFTKSQYDKLVRFCDGSEVLKQPVKHILNSAGIVNYSDYQLDMVRLGIGLYGSDSSGLIKNKLRVVAQLKTTISQIRALEPGETVGYNRNGKIVETSKIATLSIGYADGFNRRFGNGTGHVFVNGQICPVIGNVCMDMIMIDVTHAEVEVGDEVEIFGAHIHVDELAQQIGTISYEILTSVGQRVKRVYYSE